LFLKRDISYYAHIKQVDHGGNPYIFHLVAVSENCKSTEAKAAGYLHDILEDTDTTAEDLLKDGIPESVVTAVEKLTRTSDETYKEYLIRLKSNPIAREVKLADLADNLDLSRLNDAREENSSLVKRYRKAVEFLNE
jgi:Guanosine polyphosphate pyrophosphohydrolases/synthetases